MIKKVKKNTNSYKFSLWIFSTTVILIILDQFNKLNLPTYMNIVGYIGIAMMFISIILIILFGDKK